MSESQPDNRVIVDKSKEKERLGVEMLSMGVGKPTRDHQMMEELRGGSKGKEDEEELLGEYVLSPQERSRQPRPVPLMKMREKHRCCYVWWTAPMPFFINFPMAVFLVLAGAFLIVCTVFVCLEMAGYGPFVLGNCPIWTWAAWIVVNIFMFFTIWALFWLLREVFIRKHYRVFKVTYSLWGVWPALVMFVFSISNFPLLQLLVNYYLAPQVLFWLSRLVWTFVVISVFWLLWELLCRYIIVRIEKDRLWTRLALSFWKEEMLRQMLRASEQYGTKEGFVESAYRFGKINSIDEVSLDEYEIFKGRVLVESEVHALDVPSALLISARAEERQVRICRLAVKTTMTIFEKIDADRSDAITLEELEKMFGVEGALEHLSLWDKSNAGKIGRRDVIDVLLEIFTDREEIVEILKNQTPLAHVLKLGLGVLLGFITLIIILQLYEIQLVSLILPLLAFALPLVFIFGRTLQVMWESFVVLFVLQPWSKGDYITSSGQSMTVDEISLYTTTGYDAMGVWTAIPNAPALSTTLQNFGRATMSRIRVYFRIAVSKPGSESYVFDLISNHMKEYCARHRSIYAHNKFSAWLENQDFNDGEFDDLRGITMAVNAQLLTISKNNLDEYRKAKTDFLNELRSIVASTAARGFSSSTVEVILDASTKGVLPPLLKEDTPVANRKNFSGTVDL